MCNARSAGSAGNPGARAAPRAPSSPSPRPLSRCRFGCRVVTSRRAAPKPCSLKDAYRIPSPSASFSNSNNIPFAKALRLQCSFLFSNGAARLVLAPVLFRRRDQARVWLRVWVNARHAGAVQRDSVGRGFSCRGVRWRGVLDTLVRRRVARGGVNPGGRCVWRWRHWRRLACVLLQQPLLECAEQRGIDFDGAFRVRCVRCRRASAG